ncbi:G1 family glutamic endopeptidase [Microbacterium sp. ASV81]|uniref:G1 family glutamic endopeptidase n=1 Tax=Microbacterium capsulatum TaxID=3041921 RepID=A0ABU0XEF4_9MICO|nr:G1 family glutamic endopeptidase [Microbacterium sp. ASV81]MDQ4212565.1 G1 family glutamic endopeptidase [Microbacterium sp. ASV81]
MTATLSASLIAAAVLWPVAADARTTPSDPGADVPTVAHKPRIPHGGDLPGNAGWASTNWSGYAETGSNFTSITGRWTVPAVSPTRGSSYSSNWIGIDGYNNSNLIQTGTESDYVNGTAYYAAWWEILPANETRISMPVNPGDVMTASIAQTSGTTWTITIADTTTTQSFTTTQTYTGPRTSAEWIEEAPTVNNKVAQLAHFGPTAFDPGTVDGHSANLVPSEAGVMIQNRRQVSTPSVPDVDGDGFGVAYGPTAPAAPAS